MVRIESCDMDEENRRFHRAQRAEYYWEEDRQAEAEALMAKLDRNPSVFVRKLRQTLQGAQRLRRSFAALAALVAGGPAGEPARPLADLDAVWAKGFLTGGMFTRVAYEGLVNHRR
jgi:hypothetical protein